MKKLKIMYTEVPKHCLFTQHHENALLCSLFNQQEHSSEKISRAKVPLTRSNVS